MTTEEMRKSVGKPELNRLKALGTGLRVGRVLGNRVLVKTVVPFTKMDELEKAGLLYAPKAAKEQNTPKPTTGVVVAVGEGVPYEVIAGANMSMAEYLVRQQQACMTQQAVPQPERLRRVEEGDMIMFSKFAGFDFMIENEDYRIVEVSEILCTLVDTEGVVTEVKAE